MKYYQHDVNNTNGTYEVITCKHENYIIYINNDSIIISIVLVLSLFMISYTNY